MQLWSPENVLLVSIFEREHPYMLLRENLLTAEPTCTGIWKSFLFEDLETIDSKNLHRLGRVLRVFPRHLPTGEKTFTKWLRDAYGEDAFMNAISDTEMWRELQKEWTDQLKQPLEIITPIGKVFEAWSEWLENYDFPSYTSKEKKKRFFDVLPTALWLEDSKKLSAEIHKHLLAVRRGRVFSDIPIEDLLYRRDRLESYEIVCSILNSDNQDISCEDSWFLDQGLWNLCKALEVNPADCLSSAFHSLARDMEMYHTWWLFPLKNPPLDVEESRHYLGKNHPLAPIGDNYAP